MSKVFPEIVETLARSVAMEMDLRLEAAALSGEPEARGEAAMARQGTAILELGAQAVLVKGGHFEGSEAADLLIERGGIRRFTAPRIATKNTHGTGCTLSSAIAAGLARGMALHDAVALGKKYVSEAIAASGEIEIGEGHGPVHHFHAYWKRS